MKVSIITTVYKAEKDLPRLLESMMAQKSPELEFFLIDNGSPDRCGDICREYMKKDSRFVLYELKDNIGYIRARNLGMEICEAEYIGFCDSDDYLEPGGYDRAIEILKKTGMDLYITAYNTVTDGNLVKSVPPFNKGLYIEEMIYNDVLPQCYGPINGKSELKGFAWKQIFKKELLIKNKIKFDVNLQPYEDEILNLEMVRVSKKIYVDDNVIYNYVVNPESITAQSAIKFDLKDKWQKTVLFYNSKYRYASTMTQKTALSNQMLNFMYSLVLLYSKQRITRSNDDYMRYFDETVDVTKAKEMVANASKHQTLRNCMVYKAIVNRKLGLLIRGIRFAYKIMR